MPDYSTPLHAASPAPLPPPVPEDRGSPEFRTAVYAVVGPLSRLAILYGLVSDTAAIMWSGLVVSLLDVGFAIANRPTRRSS